MYVGWKTVTVTTATVSGGSVRLLTCTAVFMFDKARVVFGFCVFLRLSTTVAVRLTWVLE